MSALRTRITATCKGEATLPSPVVGLQWSVQEPLREGQLITRIPSHLLLLFFEKLP